MCTSVAGLVDPLDAENAGNFLYVDENGFELALIGDFQVGVNARVSAIGAAFEVVNVGTGTADDGDPAGEVGHTVILGPAGRVRTPMIRCRVV